MRHRFHSRPGTSLVELLIFLAIFVIVIGVTIPLLFQAAENRLLQQTVSVVEQNGTQMVQSISLRIRNAERIVSPAAGKESTVLVLQTASGGTNPTIIGVQSGTLVIVQRTLQESISNTQVAVESFKVRNTSTSDSSQSVNISFMVSRTIRLQQPHSYRQRFDLAVGLLPDDERLTELCNCPSPSCLGNNTYEWYLCDTDFTCDAASTTLTCS